MVPEVDQYVCIDVCSHLNVHPLSPLCRNVLEGEDHDITALVTHGAALWLGTRTGYILLLDPSALVDGHNPLLGLQYCGEGKLKHIRPLVSLSKPTARLEVIIQLYMNVYR